MADPLTIIGTTAAVIDLAKLSWKIVNTAYRYYCDVSEGETLDEDENLEKITQGMKSVLDDLSNRYCSSLTTLVSRSKAIGQEIIQILEKTKLGEARSLRASMKASLKSIWTKDKVDKLRSELDHIMIQLGVHLQMMTRSETGSKLDLILEKTGIQEKELVSYTQLLDSLKDGQKVQLETLNDLQKVLILSTQAVKTNSQRKILNALKFQDMESRFKTTYSSQNTFQWCLYKARMPTNYLGIETPFYGFRDWLATGKGVFHISGKMGSGKSTLMKYIVQEAETKRLLDQWAGSERKLVVASFFFWKPGNYLQRSFEGLLRSLVYTVLGEVPDLIPTIFPKYWDLSSTLPWLNQPDPEISYEEIRAAFKVLTQERAELNKYCFCFFIDGLDEFQDPHPLQSQRLLAEDIQSWTDLNLGNVKVCVSSREDDPFMNVFSSKQRFRLHLLTAGDICKTATVFLEGHNWFKTWSTEDQQKLVKSIVNRANGVFLWVTWALRDIEDALNQRQDPSYIAERLDCLPGEVDAFFRQIVETIPTQNRREAWAVLATVTATRELDRKLRPILFQYSLLRYLDKTASFWAGPDDLIRKIREVDARRRVDSFSARLNNLCRGLVELDHGDRPPREEVEGVWLTFTHRSISEHFEHNLPVGGEIQKFFDTFDVQTALIQCLIVELKLQSPKTNEIPRAVNGIFILLKCEHLVAWLKRSGETHHLRQLGILEDTLLEWQHGRRPVKGPDWSRFDHYYAPSDNAEYSAGGLVSLLALSCRLNFVAFVEWCITTNPDLIAGDRTKAELLFGFSWYYPNAKHRMIMVGRPVIALWR